MAVERLWPFGYALNSATGRVDFLWRMVPRTGSLDWLRRGQGNGEGFTVGVTSATHHGADVDRWSTKLQSWSAATLKIRAGTLGGSLASGETMKIDIYDRTTLLYNAWTSATAKAVGMEDLSFTLNASDWGGSGLPNIARLRAHVYCTNNANFVSYGLDYCFIEGLFAGDGYHATYLMPWAGPQQVDPWSGTYLSIYGMTQILCNDLDSNPSMYLPSNGGPLIPYAEWRVLNQEGLHPEASTVDLEWGTTVSIDSNRLNQWLNCGYQILNQIDDTWSVRTTDQNGNAVVVFSTNTANPAENNAGYFLKRINPISGQNAQRNNRLVVGGVNNMGDDLVAAHVNWFAVEGRYWVESTAANQDLAATVDAQANVEADLHVGLVYRNMQATVDAQANVSPGLTVFITPKNLVAFRTAHWLWSSLTLGAIRHSGTQISSGSNGLNISSSFSVGYLPYPSALADPVVMRGWTDMTQEGDAKIVYAERFWSGGTPINLTPPTPRIFCNLGSSGGATVHFNVYKGNTLILENQLPLSGVFSATNRYFSIGTEEDWGGEGFPDLHLLRIDFVRTSGTVQFWFLNLQYTVESSTYGYQGRHAAASGTTVEANTWTVAGTWVNDRNQLWDGLPGSLTQSYYSTGVSANPALTGPTVPDHRTWLPNGALYDPQSLYVGHKVYLVARVVNAGTGFEIRLEDTSNGNYVVGKFIENRDTVSQGAGGDGRELLEVDCYDYTIGPGRIKAVVDGIYFRIVVARTGGGSADVRLFDLWQETRSRDLAQGLSYVNVAANVNPNANLKGSGAKEHPDLTLQPDSARIEIEGVAEIMATADPNTVHFLAATIAGVSDLSALLNVPNLQDLAATVDANANVTARLNNLRPINEVGRVFKFRAEFSAANRDTVTVPIESFELRLRSGRDSYGRLVSPSSALKDLLVGADRPRITLYYTAFRHDGVLLQMESLLVGFNVRYWVRDQTGEQDQTMISGGAQRTYADVKDYAGVNLIGYTKTGEQFYQRMAFDPDIVPGDTILIGDTFVILDEVGFVVSDEAQYMEVKG